MPKHHFRDPTDNSIWTSDKPLIRDIKGNVMAYVTNGKQSQWIRVSNPKVEDDEAMRQAKAKDIARARVRAADDLTNGISNIMTLGMSGAMKEGAEDLSKGKYIKGAAELATPALFGPGLTGNIIRAGIGGYNLLNKNGIQKTAKYINNGNYGNAISSGIGDLLNAGMAFQGGSQLLKNSKLIKKFNNQ